MQNTPSSDIHAHARQSPERPPPPDDRHPLGTLIREARTRARMSRATLALHAGLSPSTIKNIEHGRDSSPHSLRCLASVRELALPDDLVAHYLPESSQPNAWYAPGFAPISEFRRMLQVLHGHGGAIEQTHLYFDLASALDWMQIAAQPDYADVQRVLPLERAALALYHTVGERGMDVIALGPGTGHLETRLVGLIAAQLQHPAIRFYLLDVSQPLLAEAYRHAADTLGAYAGISPIAVLGDFHRLPQFGQILYSVPAAPRRQIICMLGGTFANLDNELRFLRDSLCGFGPGSLLLLDFPMPFAPVDQPDEIRRKDPWLSGTGKPSAWRERVMAFWAGPLRRYISGCEAVDIRMELTTSASPIPGSYAVEARARVRISGEPDRDFSVFRIKRHEPSCLARALREIGWDPLDGWPYGADVGYPRALSLFARR